MKLWSRSPSLQRKIITAIVMVGLLPLSLSLLITYLEERRALREALGANFKETAVETASKLEMQVARAIGEAQQLAVAPFLHTAVAEANRSYADKDEESVKAMIQDWQGRWRIRTHRNEFPLFMNRIVTNTLIRLHDIRKADYVGILVTDSKGALVVSSIPQLEYYYGKTAWWQAVFKEGKGQTHVSEIYFDPSFGTHVLNVSVPILDDERQEAIGAVTLLLRRDTLYRVISEVTLGATGHAMLLSADGVLMCPVLAPEEHVIMPALIGKLAGTRAGWAVVEDDSHGGHNSIVGFAPVRLGDKLSVDSLGGKPWFVVVRQDPAETYAPLNQLLIKVTIYGAVVLTVLWAIGILVAGRIVRPIRILHEGAQRIGAGALDHRLKL